MIPQPLRIGCSKFVDRKQPAAAWRCATAHIILLACGLTGCAFRPDGNLVRVNAGDLLGNGDTQYRHAMHAYEKGQIEKARLGLEKVVRHNPRHASAHNNLGLIYYDTRQLVAAAEHFDVAIDLLPDSPSPRNNLGMTLEAGGRVDEAIGFYVQAHELNPENPLYLGNLLRARIRLGEQSPEIIEDLRFLAFIETRPDWVSWVDEMLAIHMNPALDRGPQVEDNPLDGNRRRRSDEAPAPILSPQELQGAPDLEPIEGELVEPAFQPYPDARPDEVQTAPQLPLPAPQSTSSASGFWEQLDESATLPVPGP